MKFMDSIPDNYPIAMVFDFKAVEARGVIKALETAKKNMFISNEAAIGGEGGVSREQALIWICDWYSLQNGSNTDVRKSGTVESGGDGAVGDSSGWEEAQPASAPGVE